MKAASVSMLRANARTIHELGLRYGLRAFALSADPGELVATLDAGRSYFDITQFEADVTSLIGAQVEAVPRGPGVDVREIAPLDDVRDAARPAAQPSGVRTSCSACVTR